MKKIHIIVLVIVVVIVISFPSLFKDILNKQTTELNDNLSLTKKVKKCQQTELTFEKLKTYKGFENMSEEESTKQIEAIKKMAKVMFHLYENEQNKLKTI
ncbi:MAG TPA: hypothetical protein VN026_01275 [Bacteroidia bacterium]|jgi:ribosomal protein S21|nr:hypothetical protein [Bacteroidia bacterium]